MIPSVFLISIGLLGIEDLGVQIEEPFSILPLGAICATAQVRFHFHHLIMYACILERGLGGADRGVLLNLAPGRDLRHRPGAFHASLHDVCMYYGEDLGVQIAGRSGENVIPPIN